MDEIQVGQIWEEKGRYWRRMEVKDVGLNGVRIWAQRVGSFTRRGGHGQFLYPRIGYEARMFVRRFRLVSDGKEAPKSKAP